MATVPWTVTATDSDGQSVTQSGSFIAQYPPPVITNVTATPVSAPVGTSRHIAVNATGQIPLTYSLTVGNGQPITNQTGVFDVLV